MIIKEGYNGEETIIRIYARTDMDKRIAEVWIDQYHQPNEGSIDEYRKETLAYVTLDELLALKDEINKAIQELVK